MVAILSPVIQADPTKFPPKGRATKEAEAEHDLRPAAAYRQSRGLVDHCSSNHLFDELVLDEPEFSRTIVHRIRPVEFLELTERPIRPGRLN